MKISKMFSLVFLTVYPHQGLAADFVEMPLISAKDLQVEMQAQTGQSVKGNNRRKFYKNQNLLVINVLSPSICSDCHIPGSINVPLHTLTKKSQDWRKDANIVLHCASLHCPLSRYAFEMLSKLGFTRIRVFDGGLQEWTAEKFPRVGRCRAGYLRF
ncbi:MAG: rhodanese-like domain-containing protein [Candidatus Babeliales bacterium]|jgi:rhodanese-related sulfurtransferase